MRDSVGQLAQLMLQDPMGLEKSQVPCCLWGLWHMVQLDAANDSGSEVSQSLLSSGSERPRQKLSTKICG